MYGGGSQNQAEKISKNAFRPVPVQKSTFPAEEITIRLHWQAPDAPSKRTTKKCTIKTYSFDLFSEVLESHSSSDLVWVVGTAAACWGGSARDL